MLKIENYKITADEFNYILKKKKGEKQWATIGFYANLKQALEVLYQRLEREEIKKFILDLDEEGTLDLQKTAFFKRLSEIKKEIMEALDERTKNQG